MKICFLAGANSVHSFRWIRYFAERGHEIHWITMVPSIFPPLPGTRIYDLSTRMKMWATSALAAMKIRRIVRKIAPDLLHAHYVSSYGVLGAIADFQPYVLTAWGSDILFAGKRRFRGALVRRALRKARIITCDAAHMVEALLGLGSDPGKVKVVYFGVETDRFTPGAPEAAQLERWGLTGKRVVISLRNLEPVYSIDTLLDAVPAVLRAVPEARFVIAGDGSSAAPLKEHAARLGIQERVRFVGRYRSEDLTGMLRSSEAYVSTSLSDGGIAASTAEAMACGVPVAISDTGENSRWIDSGRSGLLFPAKDAAALANCLVSLLTDEARRRSIGETGRSVIVERNSHVREMAKMEDLYRGCVEGAPAGTGSA